MDLRENINRRLRGIAEKEGLTITEKKIPLQDDDVPKFVRSLETFYTQSRKHAKDFYVISKAA